MSTRTELLLFAQKSHISILNEILFSLGVALAIVFLVNLNISTFKLFALFLCPAFFLFAFATNIPKASILIVICLLPFINYLFGGNTIILCLLLLFISFSPLFLKKIPSFYQLEQIKLPIMAVLLMLLGSFIAHFHTFIKTGDIWRYPLAFDFRFIIGILFSFLIFFCLNNKLLSLRNLAIAIMIGGGCFLFVAIVFFISDNGIITLFDGTRLNTKIINANFISSFLELIIPFGFFAFKDASKKSTRILAIFLSIIFISAILLTQSRGGFIMLFILIVYFIGKNIFIDKKIFPYSILLLLFLLLIPFVAKNAVLRLTYQEHNAIMSDVARLMLYKTAFKAIELNDFFFGIGMDGFSQIKYSLGFPKFLGGPGFSSHNQFLEMWVSWGLFGLVGWIIFNISILKLLLNNRASETKGIKFAVFFALLFYFLHGLFDCQLANFLITIYHFTIIGIAFFIIAQKPNQLQQNIKNFS